MKHPAQQKGPLRNEPEGPKNPKGDHMILILILIVMLMMLFVLAFALFPEPVRRLIAATPTAVGTLLVVAVVLWVIGFAVQLLRYGVITIP